MNVDEVRRLKGVRKIAVLTAYDYQTAKIIDVAGIDMILVGDSLGMVVLGYDDTKQVTMEDMIRHTQAVRRGAPIARRPLRALGARARGRVGGRDRLHPPVRGLEPEEELEAAGLPLRAAAHGRRGDEGPAREGRAQGRGLLRQVLNRKTRCPRRR